MTLIIGLDIGTTKLAALALDAASGRTVALVSAPNDARRDNTIGGLTRAELDLARLTATALTLLRALVARLPNASEVAGLGVTGQQHGLALLDAAGQPLAPAITWQDQRALEVAGTGTHLSALLERAGGPDRYQTLGCQPAPGYLAASLFWLAGQGRLSPHAWACLIPDAFVATLIGALPPTDPTLAGSTALYDVQHRRWDRELIAQLGLDQVHLVDVYPTGTLAGSLAASVATLVGLRPGTPVAVALGDNQASFIGSVSAPWQSVLVNIGTGGQVSALVDAFYRLETLDTRAFPDDAYLLVGAGSSGGSSLSHLHALVQGVGQTVFGIPADERYDRLVALAGQAHPGADGVRCTPHFAGTRTDPAATAQWSGLTAANLTIANLARALLEGVATDAFAFWQRMAPVTGPREHLIGAGNGLSRNAVLQEAIESSFGLPFSLAARQEAAAWGAALSAGVALGLYASHTAAMRQASASESTP